MVESKVSNKSGITLLIIFVAMIVIALIGFFIISGKDSEKEKDNNPGVQEPESNTDVSYYDFKECIYDDMEESDGKIYINGELVYECQSTGEFGCYITRIDDFEYCNQTDSVVLLTDNQKDFLFNFKTKEIIMEADYFNAAVYDEFGKIAYLVFYQDGKAGLATLKGNAVIEPIYDNVAFSYGDFTGEYSLKNGVVAAELDGKIGVLEMETGDEVVPFEYDSIRVYDGYYVLNKDNKATLVDSELNTVLEGNFNDIVISIDTIIAENNKVLSFYDLSGNKIIEDTVKINRSYSNGNDTGYTAFSMDQYNQVITLTIYGDNIMDYEACYNLDLTSKKLETLDCKEVFDDYDE